MTVTIQQMSAKLSIPPTAVYRLIREKFIPEPALGADRLLGWIESDTQEIFERFK